MKIQNFFDNASKRQRFQDLSHGHFQAFVAQIILVYCENRKPTINRSFPITESQTYRDVLESWISDMETNAPKCALDYFQSWARELRLGYPNDITGFERDGKSFGPFLDVVGTRMKWIEKSIQGTNSIFTTFTIQMMSAIIDVIPESELRGYLAAVEARRSTSTSSKLTTIVPGKGKRVADNDLQSSVVKLSKNVSTNSSVPSKSKSDKTSVQNHPLCQLCGRNHINANSELCYQLANKHPNINNEKNPDGSIVEWAKSREGIRLHKLRIYRIDPKMFIDKNGNKLPFTGKTSTNSMHSFAYLTSSCDSNPGVAMCPFRALATREDGSMLDNLTALLDSGASCNFINKKIL